MIQIKHQSRITKIINILIKKGNKPKALKIFETALLKIVIILKWTAIDILRNFNYFYKTAYSMAITKKIKKEDNLVVKTAKLFNLSYWNYFYIVLFFKIIDVEFYYTNRKKRPKIEILLSYYFLEEIYFINKLKYLKLNYWYNRAYKANRVITRFNVSNFRNKKDLEKSVQNRLFLYDHVDFLFNYLEEFSAKIDYVENYFDTKINTINSLERLTIKTLFHDHYDIITTCTNKLDLTFKIEFFMDPSINKLEETDI